MNIQPIKADNEKLIQLIAYLSTSSLEWGVTGEPPLTTGHLLAKMANKAGASDKPVKLRRVDILTAGEPKPLRVLAACLRYEDEVWEFLCSEPDLQNNAAWHIIDGLRTEAACRLPGYESWPLN